MVGSLRSLAAAVVALSLLPALALAQAQAQPPERGGTLVSILNPEPPILILGLNNQASTLMVGGKIYQGLLRFDHELKPMPSLAKSWSVSADGLTYTFHLEENVRWHDGLPFTAEDVVFSLGRWHKELNARARPVLEKIESVTAPDRFTVVIRLKEPFEPLLLVLDATNLAIMPKHVYDGGDLRTTQMNQVPIGTGPFKLKEWRHGESIELVRNEDYWKPGLPYLDGIVYRVMPDAAERSAALETGAVQLAQGSDIEPGEVPRFRALHNLTVSGKGWEMFSPMAWMDLNLRQPPLNDKRFRQALILAIDRNYIREKIWHGLGRVPTGPIASTTRYYENDVPQYPHDPERAKKLLDDMGLKPDALGIRARIKNLPLPYGDVWLRTAEYVKQALAKVGIEMTIEPVDYGTWAQRLGDWQYQTSFNFVYQRGDPSLGVARTYTSSNIQKAAFANTMGYSNREVDDLFARAAVATSSAERQALFSRAQRLLVEDVPVVWLLELEFPTIYDKRLKNVLSEAVGTDASFEDVYFSK